MVRHLILTAEDNFCHLFFFKENININRDVYHLFDELFEGAAMLNFGKYNDKQQKDVLRNMPAMNTYVNKAKHKGPKKKKDLRANCGKNTNKNNLLHGKICTFTSLCSNEKKHPIQKNFRHIVLFLKIV